MEQEKKELRRISEWESARPELADYQSMRLRNCHVLKVDGYYMGVKCYWDGFGLAYHQSGKRYRSADVKF